MTQTFPLPITVAMTTRANALEDRPRYGTPADWSMGVVGNDVDIAAVSTPVVDRSSSASVTPYPIRTQTAKAAAMTPALTVLSDLGTDYGTYTGGTGRAGTITPETPYPTT